MFNLLVMYRCRFSEAGVSISRTKRLSLSLSLVLLLSVSVSWRILLFLVCTYVCNQPYKCIIVFLYILMALLLFLLLSVFAPSDRGRRLKKMFIKMAKNSNNDLIKSQRKR